jgi:cytochrome b561
MLRNTSETWGWGAKALHWIGALAILLLLGHGWWMTHLAPRGPDRLAHYAGHAALGYDFLVLVVLRVLWRWMNPVPALPADSKPWEIWLAHLGHIGLYALMLVTTVLGWALAGTMRTPMQKDIAGLTFPTIVADKTLHGSLEDWHKIAAYLLAALVLLHIAGALRHHFVKKNDVLRRMTAS